MNPLAMSIAFGFLKGLVSERPSGFSLGADLVSPVREEAVFRAAPMAAMARLPLGATAVPFALAHMATPGAGFGRFADVALGGLLYEMAFRRWGFFGAVAAHCAHNLACGLGSAARTRRIRR